MDGNSAFIIAAGIIAAAAIIFGGMVMTNSPAPTAAVVAVAPFEEAPVAEPVAEQDTLELFCQMIGAKDFDSDVLIVKDVKVNRVLNSCDTYLTAATADASEICAELMLRSVLGGETTCIPIQGDYCALLCERVND